MKEEERGCLVLLLLICGAIIYLDSDGRLIDGHAGRRDLEASAAADPNSIAVRVGGEGPARGTWPRGRATLGEDRRLTAERRAGLASGKIRIALHERGRFGTSVRRTRGRRKRRARGLPVPIWMVLLHLG